MSRKALMWLVAADTLILLVLMWLVGRQLLSTRVTAFSVLLLWVGNFAIAWWLSKRARGAPARAPRSRVVWILAWCGVWVYTGEALVYVARFTAEPSRVTASVALVGSGIAVWVWWVMLRVRRRRQALANDEAQVK